MSFTITGQAPARNTHAYLYLKCNACGAEREARASRARAGKVSCSCGESDNSLVQDPGPDSATVQCVSLPVGTGRTSTADPQIQNLPGTLDRIARDPAQADFAALEQRIEAQLVALDLAVRQQATAFAAWREDVEAKLAAFGLPLKPGLGPAIKGEIVATRHRAEPQVGAIAEVREKLTYADVVHGTSGAARDEALWASHRRGAELADTPFAQRTDEIFRELLDRFEIITEQLDQMPPPELYATLQPYMAKMNRSLNCWASENYDPTDYPITETPA